MRTRTAGVHSSTHGNRVGNIAGQVTIHSTEYIFHKTAKKPSLWATSIRKPIPYIFEKSQFSLIRS